MPEYYYFIGASFEPLPVQLSSEIEFVGIFSTPAEHTGGTTLTPLQLHTCDRNRKIFGTLGELKKDGVRLHASTRAVYGRVIMSENQFKDRCHHSRPDFIGELRHARKSLPAAAWIWNSPNTLLIFGVTKCSVRGPVVENETLEGQHMQALQQMMPLIEPLASR